MSNHGSYKIYVLRTQDLNLINIGCLNLALIEYQVGLDLITNLSRLDPIIPHDLKTSIEFFKIINPFGTILHIIY